MPDGLQDDRFIKRAHVFAGLASAGAAMVILLSFADVCTRAVVHWDNGTWGPMGGVFALVQTFASRGVARAAGIMAAGAIVIVALRLACSGKDYWWARMRDVDFLNKALLFAKGVELYAWVYLVYGAVVGANGIYNWFSEFMDVYARQGIPAGQRTAKLLEVIADVANSVIWGFLVLLLAAYVLRALILVSSRDVTPDNSTKTQEAAGA